MKGRTASTETTQLESSDHIQTTNISSFCHLRSIKSFMFLDVLRSTSFSHAHSIISYRIIFWGNSSYSEDIFKIQKRIIIIIMNSRRNSSCWQLFKDLNILPIQSQYIYSILLFVTKNKDQFLSNSQIYKVSQEECAILRESVPYVKLYRYNPKHLYPKLNGYRDNGQISLKL